MKKVAYQKRFYRAWVYPKKLSRLRIVAGETDMDILADKPLEKRYILQRVKTCRSQIERYIARDERFLTALKPLVVEPGSGALVRAMAAAAKKANVGPMAAVAGAIAESVGRDLLRKGCRDVIVENGGDIFLKMTRPVTVGVYAGRSKLTGTLRLKIVPALTPLGICTSSGTVGHSLSFGCADSIIILAKNAALADAVATATANRVQNKLDMGKAVAFARSVRGVRGVVIILKNNLASWGEIEFA